MIKSAYIISWFGDHEHADKRREYHRKQVDWFQSKGLQVVVFAQAYRATDYLTGVEYIKSKSPIPPGAARNRLLKRFYDSGEAMAIFADNDSIIYEQHANGGRIIEDINRNFDSYKDVDLAFPINPMSMPFTKLHEEPQFKNGHVFKHTNTAKGSFFLLRNLKSVYGNPLWFAKEFENYKGSFLGGEDNDFALQLTANGLGVYRFENLVLKEFGDITKSTWSRTFEDRKANMKPMKDLLVKRFKHQGIKFNAKGNMNYREFTKRQLKRPKTVHISFSGVTTVPSKNSVEQYVEVKDLQARLITVSSKYHTSAKGSRTALYTALTEAYRWQRLAKRSEVFAEPADKLIAKHLGDGVKEKKIRDAKTFVSIIKATVLYEPPSNEPPLFKNVDQLATTYSRALEWCDKKGYTAEKTLDELTSRGVVALKNELLESKNKPSSKKGVTPVEYIEALPSIAEFKSDQVADHGSGIGVFLGRIDDRNVSIIRQLPSLQDKIMEAVKGVLIRDALSTSEVGLFIQPINFASKFVGPLKNLQLEFRQSATGINLAVKSRRKPKWAKAVLFETNYCWDVFRNKTPYSMGHEQVQNLSALFKKNTNPSKWSLAESSLRVANSKIAIEVNNERFTNKELKALSADWTRDVHITQSNWQSLCGAISDDTVTNYTATIGADKLVFNNGAESHEIPFSNDVTSKKKVTISTSKTFIRQIGRILKEYEVPSLQIQAIDELVRFSFATPSGTFRLVV